MKVNLSLADIREWAKSIFVTREEFMAFADDVQAQITAEAQQFADYKARTEAALQLARDQIAAITAQLGDTLTPEQKAAILSGIGAIVPDNQ